MRCRRTARSRRCSRFSRTPPRPLAAWLALGVILVVFLALAARAVGRRVRAGAVGRRHRRACGQRGTVGSEAGMPAEAMAKAEPSVVDGAYTAVRNEMTPRTRYFLFGSVAFLLVGLCTGVVAFYSGLPMGAFGRQNARPSSLRPCRCRRRRVLQRAGCDALAAPAEAPAAHAEPRRGPAGVRARDRPQHRTGHRSGRRVPRPERHQGRTTAAWSSPAAASTSSGSKDWPGSTAGRSSDYKGKRMITRAWTPRRREGPAKSMTVAFLTPGLVAVGDTDSVKRRDRRRRRREHHVQQGTDGPGPRTSTTATPGRWAGSMRYARTPTSRRVSPARFRP